MSEQTHQENVRARFSQQARAYLSSEVHARGGDLDLLAARLERRQPRRVLDLGSGAGHASFRAAACGSQVTSYDLSDAMLDQVRAEAARRGLSSITTRQGAAEHLPFETASFDAVISRFSAHHWRSLPQSLAEARRVLAPEGLALFIDTVAPAAPLADTWLQTLELMRDPGHGRNYTVSEWQQALLQVGFAPSRVTMFRIRLDFEPWVARIGTPPPLVEALRCLQHLAPAEITAHFAIEPDGSFSLDGALLESGK